MNLLGLVKIYNTRPSILLHIQDEYTAYCLDEACGYIISEIKNGKTPSFVKHYTRPSELYKELRNQGVK